MELASDMAVELIVPSQIAPLEMFKEKIGKYMVL